MNRTTPETVTDGEKTTDEPTETTETTESTDRAVAENPEPRDQDETGPVDEPEAVEEADRTDDTDDADEETSGRLAAASAAVVSAGLGVVGLTGAWTGRVAAERETLIGQIKTQSGGSAAQQINEIYGDAWHSTALVNGIFGLLALLVGTYVLVRPAFGAPARQPQAGWVRAVARGGIALGTLGVLISIAMYFDLIVALPTTGG
ncbi:hypothetical protein [Streptomyces sp. CB02460]|uniref:hypothetical protein n=1 Tax=Streptomyces sp. CB02460 TaxID=1703941 RepID=UPI00093E21D3|nr:hypothetical protein [Streptomyces sp. CB02460]OKJ78740.1 hypothetical protein AMK30_01080 [Streptomyces sp. CB02460]